MRWLTGIGRELAALFVEDLPFTVLLGWVAIATRLVPHLVPATNWCALLLFAGYALILLDSVRRSARRTHSGRKTI